MNLKGGYLIINKDDANIYAKLQDALTNGKPVLFYENDTTCYYIDTIALDGTDIVLTKGGKTITITSSNVVTESGNIQNHLYRYACYIDDFYFNIDLPFKFSSMSLNDADTLTDEQYEILLKIKEYYSNETKFPLMVDDFSEIIGFYAKYIYDGNNNKITFVVNFYRNGTDENYACDITLNDKSIEADNTLYINYKYQLF